MRVLLAANASYVPPRGGATRSNLIWLEHLAAAGHSCRVVASLLTTDPAGRLEQIRNEEIRTTAASAANGVEVAERNGITFYSAAEPSARSQILREQIREFQPDWVLISSEDVGQMLLREAHLCAPGRVVYIAHTPQFFPFGGASWARNEYGTELVRRSAAVVAIGHHTANYIHEHIGRMPAVIHPPIYGSGPFEPCASFEQGLITMINPCAMKGLSIFLELARAMPEYQFGALPGWGTTRADRVALGQPANITLLPNCPNIEQFLRQTKVLLMPSLWYEGFGLIVMEAMLRGIPVVSSDSGGLVEAKRGTGFIVPVRPIETFEPVFDEHGMPKPVTADQDIAKWIEAIRALTSDRELYERESSTSREAALQFVGGLRAAQMEEFLQSLDARPETSAEPPSASAATASAIPHQLLEGLSPEKRALLLQRLKKKTPADRKEPA